MDVKTKNPVVQTIKRQLGVIEPLVFQSTGQLEVQCLYLIVQPPNKISSGTLFDYTPILIPISITDKTGYHFLIPLGNGHIPGLFGLDLNILHSTNSEEEHFLRKFKITLLSNIISFAKSIDEKSKSSFRTLIITAIRNLWFEHTQSPFIRIPINKIRFQRRLDVLTELDSNSKVDHSTDFRILNQIKQFVPKMTMFNN